LDTALFLEKYARARLTPTQAAVYVNVNPMVAIILEAVLSEKLTGIFVTGLVTVFGVLFFNCQRRVESE
jgi:drug/metabolite transporter (DMT)-like permease